MNGNNVSVMVSESVASHIYLLIRVQPGRDAFGVDKLKPKVPDLTQADGPGNLKHKERDVASYFPSFFTLTFIH